MRVLVCGGGSGGHVYPALAVIEALRDLGLERSDIRYVGASQSVEERLAGRAGLAFSAVESGQLRGKAPWTMATSLWKAGRGIAQARSIIADFRPTVLFSTGGYASAPVLIAGRLAGVPSLIYLPDIEPGLTIKLLSRLVDRVGVSFPESCRYFPAGKTVVSGYPVRPALWGRDKKEARERLGLASELPVLLAFGGSQGARSINRAIVRALPELLRVAQVLHLSGSIDYVWVSQARQDLPAQQRAHYHVYEYLHDEMADALAAADLAVARAGASTLGEFPAVGLPSILVPYPYSGRHQYANARFMERHGASIVIEDAELSEKLATVVHRVLTDEQMLQQMAEQARALARPRAAWTLASELSRLSAGASTDANTSLREETRGCYSH